MLIVTILCLAAVASFAQDVTTDEENKLLSLVLDHKFEDGGYTVVGPQASLSDYVSSDSNDIAKAKSYLKQNFRREGHDIDPLVDQLFARNAAAARISLPSAPDKGYLIDADGKFGKYFEKDGGGWEKWRKDNPKAHGSTQGSRPACDKEKHLLLIYMGTQSDWLAGAGWFLLYDYQEGKLELLNRIMAWVS